MGEKSESARKKPCSLAPSISRATAGPSSVRYRASTVSLPAARRQMDHPAVAGEAGTSSSCAWGETSSRQMGSSGEGPRLPRRREQFEAGAGDDSQRALAADQQLHHVVSGDVLYHPAAALGLAPVAGYKAHADTVIAQAAVAMAQRPIQSGSQQSTDGAALRLRGVAGKKQAVFGDHRRQLRNCTTCANADGQIAGIVMLHGGEARSEKQNIDLRWQISNLLLGETSGGNHTQAMLIGELQNAGNLIGGSRGDRKCRSNTQNVPRLQLRRIFSDMFGSANGAQVGRKSSRHGCGAHSPSCISTGFWVGPVISRHMRGVGKIFCGFSLSLPLKALRRLIITSRSWSVNNSGIKSRFSNPTPCSPVMEPPASMQNCNISRLADCTR